jgi:hypothetical protein
MRKYLPITAAFVTALAASAFSAGTAGASTGTGTQLRAGKTCVYQPLISRPR